MLLKIRGAGTSDVTLAIPCQAPTPTDQPVAALPAAPQFDVVDLVDRMMGSEDLARRVVGIFIDEMPGQLAALHRAVSRANANDTRMIAHSIKGAAANVGGECVRQLAAELEKVGAAGNLEAAAELLPVLDERFQSLRPVMQEFRKQ